MSDAYRYYGIVEPGYGLVFLTPNARKRDRIMKALPKAKGRASVDVARSWREPEENLGFRKTDFWMQMQDVAVS